MTVKSTGIPMSGIANNFFPLIHIFSKKNYICKVTLKFMRRQTNNTGNEDTY